MPKKYHSEARPKRVIRSESTRRFIDANDKPLTIHNRYKISTKFNDAEDDIIWWEVYTDIKPIIGMDNFDKPGLQLIQRQTKSGQSETIYAVKTPTETETHEREGHGDRKNEIYNHGNRADENAKFRKSEIIKYLNSRTRKSQHSRSWSPEQQKKKNHWTGSTKNEIDDPDIAERRKRLTGQFEKLFTVSQTVRNFEYNVQFKGDI